MYNKNLKCPINIVMVKAVKMNYNNNNNNNNNK